MLKLVFPLLSVALSLNALAESQSFKIDPLHTYPYFTVGHLGFSTMHGRFDKSSGKLTMDAAAKTGSLEFEIDVASVDTGYQKRDDHLRSPDFFNAKEFPTITFKSTNVTFDGDKPANIEGNLTLLGVTKPVSLKVDATNCGENPMNKKEYRCGFDVSTEVKRSDFGMKYGIPAIGDNIKLAFEVEAIRD